MTDSHTTPAPPDDAAAGLITIPVSILRRVKAALDVAEDSLGVLSECMTDDSDHGSAAAASQDAGECRDIAHILHAHLAAQSPQRDAVAALIAEAREWVAFDPTNCGSLLTRLADALEEAGRAQQPAAPQPADGAEREYLRSLKPGERVIETGRSGTRGWTGTVYEMSADETGESRGTGVRWDATNGGTPPGVMCTSVTHGTRRIRDVLDGWASPEEVARLREDVATWQHRAMFDQQRRIDTLGEERDAAIRRAEVAEESVVRVSDILRAAGAGSTVIYRSAAELVERAEKAEAALATETARANRAEALGNAAIVGQRELEREVAALREGARGHEDALEREREETAAAHERAGHFQRQAIEASERVAEHYQRAERAEAALAEARCEIIRLLLRKEREGRLRGALAALAACITDTRGPDAHRALTLARAALADQGGDGERKDGGA